MPFINNSKQIKLKAEISLLVILCLVSVYGRRCNLFLVRKLKINFNIPLLKQKHKEKETFFSKEIN